jgi:hypothetical protein
MSDPTGTPSPNVTKSDAAVTATARPTGSPLRYLLPTMAGLLVVAAIVWATRPKSEVYNPEPPPPKTVAEVQKQIDDVKKNDGIPKDRKGMILGLLNAELEKAKAAEAKGETKAP